MHLDLLNERCRQHMLKPCSLRDLKGGHCTVQHSAACIAHQAVLMAESRPRQHTSVGCMGSFEADLSVCINLIMVVNMSGGADRWTRALPADLSWVCMAVIVV